MLILTRKEGQTIHVGDDITITVCQVAGGRVRIGLHAPKNINIRRGELVEAKPTPQPNNRELIPG